ncbi:MAG TPA: BrnA antitoxin family protein [Bradyrhizobium sp.]|nr:BrnA antitoxin family protein [Bradyrhizobium sp.]
MSPKMKFDPSIHDDNPEWTRKDFAKSRPAEELPPEILSQFQNKPGRPKLENPKQPVKLRLDSDVVMALRATGPGWQTRINEMLRANLKGGKIRFMAGSGQAKGPGRLVRAATKHKRA